MPKWLLHHLNVYGYYKQILMVIVMFVMLVLICLCLDVFYLDRYSQTNYFVVSNYLIKTSETCTLKIQLSQYTREALSNPFATRHMWRTEVEMWRMDLILNTSKIEHFPTKFDISSLIHTFLLKTNQKARREMDQDMCDPSDVWHS